MVLAEGVEVRGELLQHLLSHLISVDFLLLWRCMLQSIDLFSELSQLHFKLFLLPLNIYFYLSNPLVINASL